MADLSWCCFWDLQERIHNVTKSRPRDLVGHPPCLTPGKSVSPRHLRRPCCPQPGFHTALWRRLPARREQGGISGLGLFALEGG